MNDVIAIRLEGVSKTFGRRKKRVDAVVNVDLEVSAGQVYGFLGPNGAGKSTTIRLIMDLIRPTQGTVSVYGRPVARHHAILRQVGALVEGAAFYDFLTGRKNLELLARTSECYDGQRIDTLLARVGMTDRADYRVKGYSTGMKQRLGLAAALLNDPDLIILDEPTGGLDPTGIQEVRHFIRELVDEDGKTVFLSSHILSEVEQVCDRVAIIHKGKLVREGAVADLLAAQAEVKFEVDPVATALTVLQPEWPVTQNGRWLTVAASREATPTIVQQLVAADVRVYQVSATRQSLEDYFISVMAAAEAGADDG
jgi:ABC-2 type transport system ATP-binding protein